MRGTKTIISSIKCKLIRLNCMTYNIDIESKNNEKVGFEP